MNEEFEVIQQQSDEFGSVESVELMRGVKKAFLLPYEVAELLRLPKKRVYDLINDIDNPLPSVKIGYNLRVPVADLAVWLDGCRHRPWE